MEFHTLQEYYTFSKGVVYLLMGGILVAVTLYWQFLMGGKDDSKDAHEEHDGHNPDHS